METIRSHRPLGRNGSSGRPSTGVTFRVPAAARRSRRISTNRGSASEAKTWAAARASGKVKYPDPAPISPTTSSPRTWRTRSTSAGFCHSSRPGSSRRETYSFRSSGFPKRSREWWSPNLRPVVAGEDDGRVVDAAVRIGGIEQLLRARFQVCRLLLQNRLEDPVLHHSRQPVRAEEEEISRAGIVRIDLHVDLPLLPQRAQDDVLLGEVLCLFLGDLAQAEVLLDERVIDGDPLELVVAEEVPAAVPGVCHVRARFAVALCEVERDAGGAHVFLRSILLRNLHDARVAKLDGGDQAVLVVAPGAVVLEGPGGLGILAGELEELLHLADGDAARHLACGVAAHAVEHRVEVLFGIDEVVVLVVVPLHPDIGPRGVADTHDAALQQALPHRKMRLPCDRDNSKKRARHPPRRRGRPRRLQLL